jgi:hypothetical protein
MMLQIVIRFQGKEDNFVILIYKFENRGKQPHESPYRSVGGQPISSFLRTNEMFKN